MSRERKKVESAVMTLDRSSIIRNVRSASPNSLAARRSPIPWVPLKYSSIRKMMPKMKVQKNTPTRPKMPHLNLRSSSVLLRFSLDRTFGPSSQRTPELGCVTPFKRPAAPAS